jgi:hypothetical protein
MRKKQSILGTLIFAAVFFVGGFMAYQHITKPMAEEAAASKEWPTVEGVIAHAELNKSRDSDGNDMYSANINYDYVVDGKQLNSSGVRTVVGSTSSQSSVKKTLRKYAEGKKVTVHYDPEFPNSAVLEPGTGLLFGILLKLPLLFCLISVLMVVQLFKRLFLGR